MDTAEECCIKVHLNKDDVLQFWEVNSGLFILNPFNKIHDTTKFSFLNLISNNKLYYTKRELQAADAARRLYIHCNMPGYQKFIELVQMNYFRNSPVTAQNVQRALTIYGEGTAALQGHMTRRRPQPMTLLPKIPMPTTIRDLHSTISVSMDYLYVQGIPMLHSISGSTYMFRTLEPVFKAKANKADILKGVRNIINTYQARGIEVQQVNAH